MIFNHLQAATLRRRRTGAFFAGGGVGGADSSSSSSSPASSSSPYLFATSSSSSSSWSWNLRVAPPPAATEGIDAPGIGAPALPSVRNAKPRICCGILVTHTWTALIVSPNLDPTIHTKAGLIIALIEEPLRMSSSRLGSSINSCAGF